MKNLSIKIMLTSLIVATGIPVYGLTEVSFSLISLDSGRELDQQKSSELFIPASVTKLIPAILTLNHYGHNAKFKTYAYATTDELYLQGAGDPSLSFTDFRIFAQKLKPLSELYYEDEIVPKAKNISTYFGSLDVYNPAISSFNFSRSRIPLYFTNSYKLRTDYQTRSMQAQLNLTASKWDPLFKLQEDESIVIWDVNKKRALSIASTDSTGKKLIDYIPMLNPSTYALEYFNKFLNSKFLGQKRIPAEAEQVGWMEGDTLGVMMKNLLLKSDNSYAELLASRLMYDLGHRSNSLEEVASFLQMTWNKTYPSLDLGEARLVRSSGLSPKNVVSAQSFAKLLSYFYNRPIGGKYLKDLLSVSGLTGELKKELPSHDLIGRVQGKSGYLHYVRGLAGYLRANSGKIYAFALFINDKTSREILNDRTHPDFKLTEDKADAWAKKTRGIRDSILARWSREN